MLSPPPPFRDIVAIEERYHYIESSVYTIYFCYIASKHNSERKILFKFPRFDRPPAEKYADLDEKRLSGLFSC